jgi:hypothetical protein
MKRYQNFQASVQFCDIWHPQTNSLIVLICLTITALLHFFYNSDVHIYFYMSVRDEHISFYEYLTKYGGLVLSSRPRFFAHVSCINAHKTLKKRGINFAKSAILSSPCVYENV